MRPSASEKLEIIHLTHGGGANTASMNRTAVLYALVSAALFGASAPAAKALLGSIEPIVLAGLLYCGAGMGIAVLRRAAPALLASPQAREQALGRQDWPWLAGAIAAGGILGPLLLMAGSRAPMPRRRRSCSPWRAQRPR